MKFYEGVQGGWWEQVIFGGDLNHHSDLPVGNYQQIMSGF